MRGGVSIDEKKLFSKRDALFFAALVSLAALLFLLFSLAPRGTAAVVERGGEVLAVQELPQLSGPKELAVEGDGGVSLTVTFYPDGAAVTASGCPDQVCVRTGKITRTGETAVCLPAGVSVRLTGGEGADAATY